MCLLFSFQGANLLSQKVVSSVLCVPNGFLRQDELIQFHCKANQWKFASLKVQICNLHFILNNQGGYLLSLFHFPLCRCRLCPFLSDYSLGNISASFVIITLIYQEHFECYFYHLGWDYALLWIMPENDPKCSSPICCQIFLLKQKDLRLTIAVLVTSRFPDPLQNADY